MEKIAQQCRENNVKFVDSEFYIAFLPEKSLFSLNGSYDFYPDYKNWPSHRIDWIFDEPRFVVEGFDKSDLHQGYGNGNCWLVAALTTICRCPELMEKICVARDEEIGIYAFMFQRDGEWIWTVVDDHLFLGNRDRKSVV